jgi:SUKH superfamily protein
MTLDDVFQELRERNEPVPVPLRLPTTAEVDAAERQLGVRFSPDYRRFLLEVSNVVYGAIEPATVTPFSGYRYLPDVAEIAWNAMGLPRELLPICEDNGDYYCLNRAGEVVFWSHDGATDEKWSDLAAWIKQVWIEESAAD